MKFSKLFLLGALLMTPLLMNAQDFIGTWGWTTTGPDGNAMPIQVTFKADNTFTVDYGADGAIEENGEFSIKDGNTHIKIVTEGGACYNEVGVYTMTVSGDVCSAVLVSDECDARKGDSKPGDSFDMKRAK
ncbi:MAG: hypothetical protein AAFO07_29155 [Bacteroidota bacterium]